jgi:hypothetical protein
MEGDPTLSMNPSEKEIGEFIAPRTGGETSVDQVTKSDNSSEISISTNPEPKVYNNKESVDSKEKLQQPEIANKIKEMLKESKITRAYWELIKQLNERFEERMTPIAYEETPGQLLNAIRVLQKDIDLEDANLNPLITDFTVVNKVLESMIDIPRTQRIKESQDSLKKIIAIIKYIAESNQKVVNGITLISNDGDCNKLKFILNNTHNKLDAIYKQTYMRLRHIQSYLDR